MTIKWWSGWGEGSSRCREGQGERESKAAPSCGQGKCGRPVSSGCWDSRTGICCDGDTKRGDVLTGGEAAVKNGRIDDGGGLDVTAQQNAITSGWRG